MATFQTQLLRFGINGLNLAKASDILNPLECLRLTNVCQAELGGWTGRPGLTAFAHAGTNVHSITRLNNPQGGTFNRIWGIDTALYYGRTGLLTSADTGYSGNPLSLVPYRVPLSGQTWMYVADSLRMRKIDVTGLDLPIGLPVAVLTSTALDTAQVKTIENFESGFTANAGSGGVPTLSYVAAKDNNALNILTNGGAASGVYYNFADKALNVNLTTFGAVASDDEDFIHLWLKVDRPQYLEEIIIYLTTGSFTVGTLPGTSTTVNVTGFLKAFAPQDYNAVLQQAATTADVINNIQQSYTTDTGLAATPSPTSTYIAAPMNIGQAAWTEYGTIEIPLRKSDFVEFGSSPDWSAVKGITVLVRVAAPSTNVVNVQADYMYLTGGYGPDSAVVAGGSPYDYRVTNYDTRTGAEGNPSVEQASTAALYALRRAIVVDPATYGDAAIRQRVYRRGGVLTDDWFFVGTNASDGAVYTDILSDDEIAAAGVVETDNYQPVPTVNSSGTTVLNQPVPSLWGPAYDLLFACGDPYRPGYIYWCKPGNPDSWPPENAAEVCSSSEQLMNGCILGGQSYVFSRDRLYVLVPNIATDGSVTPQPTDCTEGLISPWAITTGGGVIFFVSSTGVYMTAGGSQTSLTDGTLRPMFEGQTIDTQPPIDLTLPAKMGLAYLQNQLYFQFQNTAGNTQTFVYGLLPGRQFWRVYDFAVETSGMYAETVQQGEPQMIFGGQSTGEGYMHSGVSDAGTAITATIRSGNVDQGIPRQDKVYAGDIALYADGGAGTDITIQPLFEYGTIAGVAATHTIEGPGTYLFNGLDPLVRSKTLSLLTSWTTDAAPPTVFWASYPYMPDPADHIRWQTDWLDHGLTGWQVPIFGELTLISTDVVTLNVSAKTYSGAIFTKTYTVPSTAGSKIKTRLDFQAQRGVEFQYMFTSPAEFKLYWEESAVFVQQWGSGVTTKYVIGAEAGQPISQDINPASRGSIAGGS